MEPEGDTAVLRVALAVFAALVSSQARSQAPADFSAIDARLEACSARNPGNPGVSNCTMAAKAAADRQLNAVYSTIVSGLKRGAGPQGTRDDPEILRRLIAAERAWVTWRDAECNYQSSVALGGTGEGYAYAACLYAQTKARVSALTAPEAPQNAR